MNTSSSLLGKRNINTSIANRMQIREEYSTAVRQKIKDIKIIIISEPIPGLQLRQGERFH